MKHLKKTIVSFVLILTLIFIFTVTGITNFSSTPDALAYLSHDEIDLCALTNTYIDGEGNNKVDIGGFMICCSYMDAD
jgi:hypothetical protein